MGLVTLLSPGLLMEGINKMERIFMAFLSVLPTVSLLAEEGMWTFDNFPRQLIEATHGVTIADEWLDRVRLATTRLEGGCTGSLVSDEGLVLTNHHCVRRCISQLSSAEEDLEAKGFLAKKRSLEQRCQAEQVSVLVGTQDITAQIAEAVKGKQETEANQARRETRSLLEQECREASNGALSCESVSLYNGGQYFLYKYKRYRDVRLVFVPEAGIAAFGGDPDNFMFPRYCLDMALLRVYEDGEPATTPNHLSIRESGPREGELVFVSGHPGSTERQLTVAELKTMRDVTLPVWLLRYSELRGRLIQFGKTGDEPYRIVQTPLLSIENRIKVRRNELIALLDEDLFARKEAEETSLREAIASKPHLKAEYDSAWQEIERAQETYRSLSLPYIFSEGAAAFNTVLFHYARVLVRAASERAKPNEKRLRDYTETAIPRLSQWLLAQRPIYPDLEEIWLSFSLDKMREWLGPDDAFAKLALGQDSPDSLARRVVSTTGLGDAGIRRQLWEGGQEAINDSDDPMIALALAVDGYSRAIRKRHDEEVDAPTRAASEKIARARFEIEGTSRYPDATFTLRVSYGEVRGWQEQGNPVQPFTQIATVFKRATGQDPFSLPEGWILAKPRLNLDTRFNFVTTNDITGGNSGSPVVDKDGKLVGLIFDGNIHSIAGSYWYNPANNRSVAVHPAVMLESLREVYRAQTVLDELQID